MSHYWRTRNQSNNKIRAIIMNWISAFKTQKLLIKSNHSPIVNVKAMKTTVFILWQSVTLRNMDKNSKLRGILSMVTKNNNSKTDYTAKHSCLLTLNAAPKCVCEDYQELRSLNTMWPSLSKLHNFAVHLCFLFLVSFRKWHLDYRILYFLHQYRSFYI